MSATTHPVAPEEVMAFLDGELFAEHIQAVAAHIDQCGECREIRDSMRSASQALAEWKAPAVPQSVQERVSKASMNLASVPANQFVSNFQKLLGRRSVWAWGGAAFVIFLIFFGLNNARYMRMSSPVANDDLDQYSGHSPSGGPIAVGSPQNGRGSLGKLQAREMDIQEVPEKSNSAQGGPMIARIVSLSIVVKDFGAGRASLDATLARHNGYAANLSVSTPQGAARVIEASLRIPAPQLAAAISELKALGRVENETQNGEEVTQQHADLVARLKNSRETEQRLQDVLRTRTGKVKDVLEVEEEIARVRGEIEQMEAEQKTLEHRVEFATIELKLAEEYKAQLNPPAPSVWMQLRNATINGFRNAIETVLSIVLFFAESGPTLVVWLTILGMPAWVLWRRYRRVHALGAVGGT